MNFAARMLGNDDEPPPPYSPNEAVDGSGGVNFALPMSGVLNGPEELALGGQIDQFRRLVSRGVIRDADLDGSVALVSVANGHDYSHVSDTTW